MSALQRLWFKLIQTGKTVCLLPQAIANAARERQRQAFADADEVERLDRIRQPWKYRGK